MSKPKPQPWLSFSQLSPSLFSLFHSNPHLEQIQSTQHGGQLVSFSQEFSEIKTFLSYCAKDFLSSKHKCERFFYLLLLSTNSEINKLSPNCSANGPQKQQIKFAILQESLRMKVLFGSQRLHTSHFEDCYNNKIHPFYLKIQNSDLRLGLSYKFLKNIPFTDGPMYRQKNLSQPNIFLIFAKLSPAQFQSSFS